MCKLNYVLETIIKKGKKEGKVLFPHTCDVPVSTTEQEGSGEKKNEVGGNCATLT